MSDCSTCSDKGYFYSTTLGPTVPIKCPRCDREPPKGIDAIDVNGGFKSSPPEGAKDE